MKYSYFILLGLLALTPATYAAGNINTAQMTMAQAGNITIKGKIVDERKEPLPGATIQQKGTSNGVITDIDGNGYNTATLTSDWNWDNFASSISGSRVAITVTNNGNNTADILYKVTYVNGESHFQKYAGVTVDSSDLNCALVTEGSYLVIIK